MVIPKYDINQIVFVYEKGRLVEKVVEKIRVLISEKENKVGYQFESEKTTWISTVYEFWTDETEVFKSLDDFINLNKCQS